MTHHARWARSSSQQSRYRLQRHEVQMPARPRQSHRRSPVPIRLSKELPRRPQQLRFRHVISRTATTLTILAILILGTWFYLHNQTTVGEIVMFMSYATLLIGKLEQAVGFANRMVLDAPRVREFFDVLDTTPTVYDRPDAVDPGRLRGLVEFRGVTFSYDGKRPAVVHLTFTAQPGETIALVGSTGAGKTTALALLHRMFDPQAGAIMIDKKDIRDMTLAGLRRNIGVVFQEVLLFDRTIGENLRVGKPDATEAELRAACERAHVLDVIDRNPEKFDAMAGERAPGHRPGAVEEPANSHSG
jgi:ABC-type multidrug transport system fused ATPase/permease subunit